MIASAVIVALAMSAIAALVDWRTGRIPDLLTGVAFGVGLGESMLGGPEAMGWLVSGVLAAFSAWALIEATGHRVGGGDVKMVVAAGALLGPEAVVVTVGVATVGFLLIPRRIERAAAPFLAVGVAVFALLALGVSRC